MVQHRRSTKPYIHYGIREELIEQLQMRKWSNNDLAHFSGLNLTEVQDLVSGQHIVLQPVAEKLAKAFGMPVDHWVSLQRNIVDEQ